MLVFMEQSVMPDRRTFKPYSGPGFGFLFFVIFMIVLLSKNIHPAMGPTWFLFGLTIPAFFLILLLSLGMGLRACIVSLGVFVWSVIANTILNSPADSRNGDCGSEPLFADYCVPISHFNPNTQIVFTIVSLFAFFCILFPMIRNRLGKNSFFGKKIVWIHSYHAAVLLGFVCVLMCVGLIGALVEARFIHPSWMYEGRFDIRGSLDLTLEPWRLV
jgi:hypothetical protein